MTKVVEYTVILGEGTRKRHRHETERGCVTKFAVQLEVLVGNQWTPVVRYDCAHGSSHRDEYDNKGNQTKTPLDFSFEHALTYADWDINENWQRYKTNFLGKTTS